MTSRCAHRDCAFPDGVCALQVDEVSGAVVAVKRVFKGRAGEGVNMAAVRELQLMQEIHHPNILQVHSRQLPDTHRTCNP